MNLQTEKCRVTTITKEGTKITKIKTDVVHVVFLGGLCVPAFAFTIIYISERF